MTRRAEKLLISKMYNNLNKYLRCCAVAFTIFIVANSLAQMANAATFTVSTAADSGAGSLRQAIIDANTSAGLDTIAFTEALSIKPLSSLPTITEQVMIDGYTNVPGATPNTGATGTGFNGTLVVELDGSLAGDSGIGLRISANNCTIQGLVINRFGDSGIRIDAGTGSKIYGNFIGTDTTGTAAAGNFNRGILIVGSTANQIGANTSTNAIPVASTSNVISGNFGTGISITGGGSANVRRNFIGTDKNGTADLGNTQEGVRIVDSSGSNIGGANSASRNIISGNDGSGVSIIQSSNTTSATSNVISANFIGVDVTGNTAALSGGFSTSPVGNSGSGVLINAAGNTVGGNRTTSSTGSTCVNTCNVISGNRANGVSISSNFATGNTVSGNNIGVGLDNTTTIGNRDNGIQISNLASGNTTGGTTSAAGFCNNTCNVIANNGDTASTSARAGVYVDSTAAAANAIRGNSIYNNGNPPNGNPANGLGIDLGDIGTTANDSKDPDTGANNLQNFPVITSASTTGAIQGVLNSTANSTFAIDFYSNPSTDATSSEGRTYLGSTSATTDANGNTPTFTFNATTLTAGQFITATATSVSGSVQAVGDTSEFSATQAVMTTTAAFGYEGDVSPRPNGDSFIDSDDIQQIRRFSIGLDKPYTSNEFQRSDDSPRSTAPTGSGDGYVDSDDIQQARRYAVGTDAKQTASGPITESTPPPTFANSFISSGKSVINLKNAPSAGRAVRVVSQNTSAGRTVIVPINVDTTGDEAGYTFSISFDQTKLTATNVTIGNLGGDVLFNINNTNGTIGFSVTSFMGGTIAAVNNGTLVNVTFTVAANAAPGTTNINFTDNPSRRKVSGTDPNTPLPQPTFTNGTITIVAPTAATTTISGRILSATGTGLANATVSLLDTKTSQVITTISNEEGYYNFGNIEVGKDYIISPSIKGYSFSPASKYFSLFDGLTDVDFKALRKSKVRFNN